MFSHLIDMLRDVASGMQHIVSKGFIHTVSELLAPVRSGGKSVRKVAYEKQLSVRNKPSSKF